MSPCPTATLRPDVMQRFLSAPCDHVLSSPPPSLQQSKRGAWAPVMVHFPGILEGRILYSYKRPKTPRGSITA
jgi:hypothetical protein